MQQFWAGAVLAAIASLTISSASADPTTCAAVENDLDRLACYDREVGRTTTPVIAKGAGKWTVRTDKNKLTDQTDVFLSLESEEPINCSWSRGERVQLTVRCHENTTALIVNTGCHMTSSTYNDYGDVTYRLDQEPAKTVSMTESTDNRALGLWSGSRSIPLLKQMLGKSEMIVKMTPYGSSPVMTTFQIAGLDEAIESLRKACSW